jgi:hypothetical protein
MIKVFNVLDLSYLTSAADIFASLTSVYLELCVLDLCVVDLHVLPTLLETCGGCSVLGP